MVLINLWDMYRYGPAAFYYGPFPPPLMARGDADQYRNGTMLGDARLKIFFENKDKDYK